MKYWILGSALALGACGGGSVVPPPRSAGHVPVPTTAPTRPGPAPASISALTGQTAPRLISQFGQPLLDVTEGDARKLQFGSGTCVLDAYLYPKGRELVVTHIDTRQRNGAPIDQASCIAALGKSRGR